MKAVCASRIAVVHSASSSTHPSLLWKTLRRRAAALAPFRWAVVSVGWPSTMSLGLFGTIRRTSCVMHPSPTNGITSGCFCPSFSSASNRTQRGWRPSTTPFQSYMTPLDFRSNFCSHFTETWSPTTRLGGIVSRWGGIDFFFAFLVGFIAVVYECSFLIYTTTGQSRYLKKNKRPNFQQNKNLYRLIRSRLDLILPLSPQSPFRTSKKIKLLKPGITT